MKTPVIAVADVGKTNKKLILFDSDYRVVDERSESLPEIPDADGFPSEDIRSLERWLKESVDAVLRRDDVDLMGLNFAAYGASLVHLDDQGAPVGMLENYLKPFPDGLLEKFAEHHGDITVISRETASPVLGNLNSGLQLFRIRHTDPARFARIRQSIHLPQYLSMVITGVSYSDFTSLGCHTMMWDFASANYHPWFVREGFDRLMAPLNDKLVLSREIFGRKIAVGIGIHDSSAALVPYRTRLADPFLLLSTGTWSIALCPFNAGPLTSVELSQDCLCYLTPDGEQVKASRMLLGMVHDREVAVLSERFHRDPEAYRSVTAVGATDDFAAAYRQFIQAVMQKQSDQIRLALGNASAGVIAVEGGFAHNAVFMHTLAQTFPEMKCYSADIPQGTALGAAVIVGQALGAHADVPVSLTQVQV